MLNRLNHIAVAVTNLDEGIKIYKDTLGAQVSKKLALPKHGVTTVFVKLAITKQEEVIGKNTVSAMSSGIYWGYIGLIKNILHKIKSELNYKMLVLATGGLSDLFINEVSEDIIVNKDLTITGLFIAYEEGKY